MDDPLQSYKKKFKMLGCANVLPTMLDSSSPRTDLSNLQPCTYTFLKYFHKFPVEMAGLQAQFEKLQTLQINLQKSSQIINMKNSTCTVYSSRNFESDYYFDELQMNELSAKEAFDEIPDREEYHYPILL
ncbi:hypothetical protein Leryth_023016 [Lithospermum erythrorhizon]|nr:hypothetical protein Leryth_023016 [Lithospermum erythrorhizon]